MRRLKILSSSLIFLSILLAACGGATTQSPPADIGPATEPPTELPTPSQVTPTPAGEKPAPSSGPPEPPREPPPLNLNAPLPDSPPDAEISVTIGPVTIATYNPVTITGLEYSTNLYFVARNNGDQAVTLRCTPFPEDLGMKPEWIFHFFSFQAEAIALEPGAETTFEFLVTNEGKGEAEMPFRFQVEETGDQETIFVTLRSLEPADLRNLPLTAAITGRVTGANGQPLPNAQVRLYLYNGREAWRSKSDSQGYYYINFPSIDDIRAAFGSRPLPYRSLDYFLLAEAEGHALLYQGGIAPARGEITTLDLMLEPVREAVSYRQIGELSTDGPYGYWWLFSDEGFSRLATVQGRHPPQLDVPGHFLMTDLNGNELWRIPTSNECWGFDLAADGRVAAGCHNGMVYLADAEGNLLWQVDVGNMNREVEFSPDGAYLFTGPYQGEGVALLDAATGVPVWTHRGPGEWLRNSRFSPDGQRIIAGFSGGQLIMFNREGTPLWKAYIGEFPMVLEIDTDYNIYAAGKNRELFSFDANGNLRWRRRIPNHVVTAGANNMSADGRLIVLGTVGGWVYAFDDAGEIVWQRPLPGGFQGHNALDVTPDGEWIVIGTAGTEEGGWIVLYDRHGTSVWSHRSEDQRDPSQYDHNQTGAITVAISDDGSHIAAGYGDSVIRIFERKP